MALASKGSQKWLQVAVNQGSQVLAEALQRSGAIARGDSVEWFSPLEGEEFQEYRDGLALEKVGISESNFKTPLAKFWPARGPVWDALGITAGTRPVFVEAKAHISEVASPGTRASPASLRLIKQSLNEAKKHYAPHAKVEWSETFYQYANRLAHQYFLKEVNGQPSTLVFLYFVNAYDVLGPTSEQEWAAAITILHAALGLPKDLKRCGVFDAFLDVMLLPRDASPA